MKVIFCTLAMLTCLAAAPSYAQTPGAAYVEFGGNGFFYSVNGELPVAPNLTVRVGGLNAGAATIGYRYMRRDRIFFQAAATPFFADRRVYPWAGLSIGRAY